MPRCSTLGRRTPEEAAGVYGLEEDGARALWTSSVTQGRRDEVTRRSEAENAHGIGQEFLQTRMVGLAEVRKNIEEWKLSMLEEYGALVHDSEAVEPISREEVDELKVEAERIGRSFDFVPAKAQRRPPSAEKRARVDTSAEESPVGTLPDPHPTRAPLLRELEEER